MPNYARDPPGRRTDLHVVDPGEADVGTATPFASMVFTTMATLVPMEHEINREHVIDSTGKRREARKDLGDRRTGPREGRSKALSAWSRTASPLRSMPATWTCPAPDAPIPIQLGLA